MNKRTILGIDPGLGLNHAVRSSFAVPAFKLGELAAKSSERISFDGIGSGDLVIIELPHWQGSARSNPHGFERLNVVFGGIRSEALSTGAAVFCPPSWAVRKVVRYAARRDGRFNSFLLDYMNRNGFPAGRGKLLNSNHLRDAALNVIWGFRAVIMGDDALDPERWAE